MEYWNPKTELMPRDELQSWQLKKLQTLVRWAEEKSPFWRSKLARAGVSPEGLKKLDDIESLPLLTKSEFIDNQAAHPPYGDILSVRPEIGIAHHQTSGTSGRAPLRVVESARDWQWGANAWASGLYAFGLRPGDIVYLAFGYGVFQGFWGVHYAAQKLGAATVAGGAQTSENRIRQILEMGVTVVVSTPTYAIRLARLAEQMGVNLADESRVRLLVHAGEPGASIAATKLFIEKRWGARVGDFAGMTESAGIFGFSCSHYPEGMHMMEDHFLIEVLDPQTNRPTDYGQRGELVITSFGKGSFPLIRYRTGDLVVKVPASRCSCGRSFDIFDGGILGRADDMKVVRGTNVYPSGVEGVIRQHDEVREFQILLTKVKMMDEITVKLEPLPFVPADSYSSLRDGIARELSYAYEGLRFNVEMVEPGSLPTFELKAKRVIDKR